MANCKSDMSQGGDSSWVCLIYALSQRHICMQNSMYTMYVYDLARLTKYRLLKLCTVALNTYLCIQCGLEACSYVFALRGSFGICKAYV